MLGSLLGREEGDSVLRAGYTLGYNRPGMSDFTGAIDDNPGISQTANRNHSARQPRHAGHDPAAQPRRRSARRRSADRRGSTR